MTTNKISEDNTNVFKNLFKKKNKTSTIISNKIKTNIPKKVTLTKEDTKEDNKEPTKEDLYKIRKSLANNIEKLEEYERVQVFQIIKGAQEKYTINKSGVLFDLLKLEEITIKKLNEFIKSTTAYRK